MDFTLTVLYYSKGIRMKKNKNKYKLRFKCPECDSVMHRDIIEGVTLEFCSNDALPQHAMYFKSFQEMPDSEKVIEMSNWSDSRHELYGAWYLSIQSPKDPFVCTYKIDPK